LRRNLPLLLADVVIGHGGAVGDPAHAADDAAAGQHGLGEHGLAGRGVTDDGEVANICREMSFHKA
jgi:hypothetical protein